MIGHSHYNENKIHTVNGKEIYEHIHGAVCGQFWRASFNADGPPPTVTAFMKSTGRTLRTGTTRRPVKTVISRSGPTTASILTPIPG